MHIAEARIVSAPGDAAIADQQAAIGIGFERVRLSKRIARRVEQGRAQ